MNQLCFLSSFVFLTNVLHNAYRNELIYSFLFFCLFLTSIIVHSMPTMYTNIIDKISIGAVVLFGGYTYYEKIMKTTEKPWITIIPPLFFLATIYLYIYGFFTDTYCYHPNLYTANQFHAFMHLVGSIGHHFIVLI